MEMQKGKKTKVFFFEKKGAEAQLRHLRRGRMWFLTGVVLHETKENSYEDV
jgi:hypothetical protein